LRLVKKHRAGSGLDQIRAVRRHGQCRFIARVDRKWPFPHTQRVVLASRPTWAAAVKMACGGAMGEHQTHRILLPPPKRIVVPRATVDARGAAFRVEAP
jgi:hypothetical protein